MDEIVLSFLHKEVENIPKVFFIDACRGTDQLTSKGEGEGVEEMEPKSVEQYVPKGYTHVEGNYCMAYSTIFDHKSYGLSSGSLWMPKMARRLREDVNSFQNIVDNVKQDVHDQLERERRPEKQQCESVNRLNCGQLELME